MPRKMFPLEVLQHYLDDLNSFQDLTSYYYVRLSSDYFYLMKRHVTLVSSSEEIVYRSSDYERFCNKVSLIARKQVRDYMKDIVYPYKRKVGHA